MIWSRKALALLLFRSFFVLFVFLLDNDVCINAILQIVKHVQMPKIPAVLTLCPRPVGGGIPGVCGGLQVRPVRRQQTVSLKTSGGAQAGGKPPENSKKAKKGLTKAKKCAAKP